MARKIGDFLLQAVVQVWLFGLLLTVPYYNWTYARDHGFVSWLFLGEFVATAKAGVWPYFLISSVEFGAESMSSTLDSARQRLISGDMTAMDELERLAERDNYGPAQVLLGNLYRQGQFVQGDAAAAEWFTRAAQQGIGEAQNNLGEMYSTGEGVLQDFGEAARLYRLAAEQGAAVAQFNLAVLYMNGFGVERNYGEARKWCQRAAEQGDALAQAMVGLIYLEGHGVPKDNAIAFSWYRLSAEQGEAEAQFVLGMATADDRFGVEKNLVESYKWANLAAAALSDSDLRDQAVKLRDLALAQLDENGRQEAQRLSREWNPKTWDELETLLPSKPAANPR